MLFVGNSLLKLSLSEKKFLYIQTVETTEDTMDFIVSSTFSNEHSNFS